MEGELKRVKEANDHRLELNIETYGTKEEKENGFNTKDWQSERERVMRTRELVKDIEEYLKDEFD